MSFEAIRAHLKAHEGKPRATFSIEGVQALLDHADRLQRIVNQCRLAFDGMVSVQSAIDLIDKETTP